MVAPEGGIWDVIKQNESEIGQNWSIGSKDARSWRVFKTLGNKEIICFTF